MNDVTILNSRNRSIIQIKKEKRNSIDVLFIGDSESYSTFSPMQLWQEQGFTSYVCSQAGQKMTETYYMLKNALRTQTPKVVVLETNTVFQKIKQMDGLQQTLEQKMYYYLPIMRFHDVWKAKIINRRNHEEFYKGFELRDVIDSYNGSDYMKVSDEIENISPYVQDYFNKLVTLCNDNNIKLLLVSAPSPVNYSYVRHNTIQKLADTNQLNYIDLNLMNDVIGIDWKYDTVDKGDHLNLLGAQKVTTYIGNYMKSEYQLLDHRDNPKFTHWNKEAQDYENRVNEIINSMQEKMVKESNHE